MKNKTAQIDDLKKDWIENPRWNGIKRPYTAEEVVNLRGSSGWQVAADANTAEAMYPDQSLYPVDAVPRLVRRINNALSRTDQIHWMQGDTEKDWIVPIVADAEAGFGGNLNAFELMKHMIMAGASGVHWEDQLSSAKKCGHLGGKVLVPTQEAINKLVAARLAADVMGVPTLVVARTDADAATLITSDVDAREFTKNFRENCWLIIVRRHSIGNQIWMMIQ